MSKFKTRSLEETFVLSKGYLSVECQFEQKQHNNLSLDSIVQLSGYCKYIYRKILIHTTITFDYEPNLLRDQKR